jgi:hypothetical protein
MNLYVQIKAPWWTGLYIGSLKIFAALFFTTPDVDKAISLIMKHTKITTRVE